MSAQWLNFPADSTDTVYDRKEEFLYKAKRYRRYNNYVTLGIGPLYSSIQSQLQKVAAGDFQFHIQRQYYQIGLVMSGNDFFANNYIQAHACYGLRKETNMVNFGVFLGPSFYTGVEGTPGVTDPILYKGVGGYLSLQAVSKFVAYDVGLGAELFAELNAKQSIVGIKLIAFFSGAYRGKIGYYNPHVRRKSQPDKTK